METNIKKSAVLVYISQELAEEMLCLLIAGQKFRIKIVTTADECLKKSQLTKFDVLLIETTVLKIQDRLNIKLLHKLCALLPVIVIADKEDTKIEIKIRKEKIFYYLVKPVNSKELTEVLEIIK